MYIRIDTYMYIHVCKYVYTCRYYAYMYVCTQECIEDFFLGGGTVCDTSSTASRGGLGKIYKLT